MEEHVKALEARVEALEAKIKLDDGRHLIDARQMLSRASIEPPARPEESHCDQCDLQGVCDYLHGSRGSGCKAFPLVYKLRELNTEREDKQ